MKTCRVILTTECQFSCSYCCNRLPEVQNKFKMTTVDQLVNMEYDVFNITGGEIGLCTDKVVRIVHQLKDNRPKSKIYLYTNGLISAYSVLGLGDLINGINIGIHDESDWLLVMEDVAKYINNGIKVRVHVEDKKWKKVDKYCRKVLKDNNVEVKLWKRDECDNPNEDWWIV
jgi:MoaA/NifB/PqqE/SkfB family radical SAM enzyme